MSRSQATTFAELLTASRKRLIDGVIVGERFASIISGILERAAAYGGDEAERSAHFPAKVDYTSFDEMKRELVGYALDGLFSGHGFNRVLHTLAMSGAAFGFQSVKK